MRAARLIDKVSVVSTVALLCAALVNAAAPALGSVTVAVNANIDKSIASLGTNIYPGDHFEYCRGWEFAAAHRRRAAVPAIDDGGERPAGQRAAEHATD